MNQIIKLLGFVILLIGSDVLVFLYTTINYDNKPTTLMIHCINEPLNNTKVEKSIEENSVIKTNHSLDSSTDVCQNYKDIVFYDPNWYNETLNIIHSLYDRKKSKTFVFSKKHIYSDLFLYTNHYYPSYIYLQNVCIDTQHERIMLYLNDQDTHIQTTLQSLYQYKCFDSHTVTILNKQYEKLSGTESISDEDAWYFMINSCYSEDERFTYIHTLSYIFEHPNIYGNIKDLYISSEMKAISSFFALFETYSQLFNILSPTTFHYIDKSSSSSNTLCFDSLRIPILSTFPYATTFSSFRVANLFRSIYYFHHSVPVYKYYEIHHHSKSLSSVPLRVLLILPPEKQGYFRKYIINYRDLYARISSNTKEYQSITVRLNKDEDILNKNVLYNADIMVTYVHSKILYNALYMLPNSVVLVIHLPFQTSSFLFKYCQSIHIEYMSLFSTDISSISKDKQEEAHSIIKDCQYNQFDSQGQPMNENCRYLQIYGYENDYNADIIQVLFLLNQAKQFIYIHKYHYYML